MSENEQSDQEKIGKRVCAWCGKDMGEKKGVEGTTHGMCAECKAKFDKKIEEEDNEQNKQ
ncbi:hypothetical protein A3F08_01450 [Candidatus Berkelbacteria bacterium RIFCSPHIGHO2_12_FULL_36_9]|uniref:Uncharacterized protein n=1 Tax=Candidatus Berkelbacteria bacterium RIFCSPHIGHO2_12_FULL_36_9 TaxID=1797469 RepID=A0A1F5EK89_9BACT|nr:MAG: hypothetical protein A3F08_01450 [Candidatus Berkelbacteria bacterium RIFCSPHIGHO2_12_FULL_36_9]